MKSGEPGTPNCVRFGQFEANFKNGELSKLGNHIRIQGQPLRVLNALLERPGEIVSREEIQQRLWGPDTTVDFDHSLGLAVNKLREALGDSADAPRYIETLARRGYRFIAPVSIVDCPNGAPASVGELGTEKLSSSHGVFRRFAPHFTAVLVLVIIVLTVSMIRMALYLHSPARYPFRIMRLTQSGDVLASETSVETFANLATDGTRIYFSHLEDGQPVLAQALIANGEISDLSLPSGVADPQIGSLSPDGSRLIVCDHLAAAPEQPLWIISTLGGLAKRIPGVTGHDATWMPDGQHVLYAVGDDLNIVNEDGSGKRRLISLSGRAFWLRLSPDGNHLRFTILDSDSRTSSLWDFSFKQDLLEPPLAGWSKPESECCGSWTADAKYFVFQSQHSGSNDIWAMPGASTARPLRTLPWQITSGPLDYEAPVTSPQGHKIYFVGVDSQYELLLQSITSGQFLPLYPNREARWVEYSRDGQWMAWLNASDGSLWRSRIDGNERLQLTTPPFHGFTMKWAPDNNRLAVMGQVPGSPWTIFLVDANGGGVQPLLHEQGRGEADPDWSPDGGTIVFGRVPDRMGYEKQPKAIYLVDLKTRAMTEVPGSIGLFSPRFSPDGRFIAAIRLDQRALLLFDRSSGNWRLLTASHGVGDPAWANDGRFLYFQDFLEDGKPIYRVDVRTGKLQKVAMLNNLIPAQVLDYRLTTLAPGNRLVVGAGNASVNLYEVNLDQH